MNIRKRETPKRPEDTIRDEIRNFLMLRNWFVKIVHGNAFQEGFPDLFATHSVYGPRWIEVKLHDKLRWEPSQIQDFPKFVANGAGIWVLTAATEAEYRKLFLPCNLHEMLFLTRAKQRGL